MIVMATAGPSPRWSGRKSAPWSQMGSSCVWGWTRNTSRRVDKISTRRLTKYSGAPSDPRETADTANTSVYLYICISVYYIHRPLGPATPGNPHTRRVEDQRSKTYMASCCPISRSASCPLPPTTQHGAAICTRKWMSDCAPSNYPRTMYTLGNLASRDGTRAGRQFPTAGRDR